MPQTSNYDPLPPEHYSGVVHRKAVAGWVRWFQAVFAQRPYISMRDAYLAGFREGLEEGRKDV